MGPQANLVNLFVTAWRGQALTNSFNKISGPAGGGKSATSTCISDPADSDGSEIKSTWHRGAVLPPESVAGVQRNTPAGAQAPRLYEATRRGSPPTDQSVDYSSCRLCKKQGLPFLLKLLPGLVLPHCGNVRAQPGDEGGPYAILILKHHVLSRFLYNVQTGSRGLRGRMLASLLV